MKVAVLSAAIAVAAATGIDAKFHALALGAYPSGSRVSITNQEFNVYLQTQIAPVVGPGVRNARVVTDSGNIVRGYLDIDFLKVRQAHGDKPNWLMSELLAGERPVAIAVRITSAHGKARVNVLSVSISGIVAEGRTLDFLITTFVMPTFPDAKIGQDFALSYKIDHFEIGPGVVTV